MVGVVLDPLVEDAVFVVSVKLLSKGDVLEGDFLTYVRLEQALLGLKLVNGALDTAHD